MVVAEWPPRRPMMCSPRQRRYGPGIVAVGVTTAGFDLLGAYPWAIGLLLWFLSGVLFSAWFVLVGLSLYRVPSTTESLT
jgi:hypothetical protein